MNLNEILRYIAKKWWIIMLAILVCVGAAGYKGYYHVTKLYQANATIFVSKQPATSSSSLYQELLAGLSLIKDFKEIIKSNAVLEQVKSELSTEYIWMKDMSIAHISSEVTVTTKSESHIVQISVVDKDPQKAAILTNKITEVFKDFSKLITIQDSVTIIDKAVVPTNPIPSKSKIYLAAGFVVGIIMGLIIILAIYFYRQNVRKNKEKL